MHGVFDPFSVQKIMEWVEVAPEIRAQLIAFYLQSPSLKEYCIAPLTEQLLTKYENNDSVYRAFERSRHDFLAYNINEEYNRKDATELFLNRYKECHTRRIREWANYEIAFLDDIVNTHKRLHADVDRQRS